MDLKVEIFATGQWNGMDFGIEDLNMMAASFSALGEVHKVPLKFGHNDDQPLTKEEEKNLNLDGQPALGWVDKVMVEGNKLFANFTDMPKIVYDAMKAKLYKHVSVELDMGVEHKGSYHTWVLSGVALLGADIPAVNTLADLTNYMSKGDGLSFKKRVAFTAINIKQKEDLDMGALEDAQAKIATLEAEAKLKDKESIKFAQEKKESDDKVLEFETANKVREKEAETAFFTKAKVDLTKSLEDMVKSETITPAQREKFMADFKEDKDVIERLNFTLDVLAAGTKGGNGMDKDEHAGADNKEDEGKAPDEILMTRISKLQEKEPTISFAAARNTVMKADPELAKSYVNMNGEH